MSVSKSQIKDLQKGLSGALSAQMMIVRKVRSLAATRQLFVDGLEDVISQVDVVGRSLEGLNNQFTEMTKEPEDEEKPKKRAKKVKKDESETT